MGRSPRGKVGASREDRRRRRGFRGDDTQASQLGIRVDLDDLDYIANVEALHHNAARLVDNNGVDVQRAICFPPLSMTKSSAATS